MKTVLNIYKPLGQTPLQLIDKLRNKNGEYKSLKIGFAGRLDPLAHGVMLLMMGDETKNRDEYLNLNKEYEFEVLFGISTDTYDALGVITSSSSERSESGSSNLAMKQFSNFPASPQSRTKKLENAINQFIKSKIGKQVQKYPPFSSIEVSGKPLFQWARENKLNEIKIPAREIEIYSFELLNKNQIPSVEIKKVIIENVNSVVGDFRQYEILEKWNKFFGEDKREFLHVAKFRISCSSGSYVRLLANELGEVTGSGAIALSILRTKVGEYNLKDSIKL